MTPVQIEQLWIYPVKSCRGIALSAARLGARGFAGDREWMIVDERGRFLTQRTQPRLACIVPTLSDEALTLTAPVGSPLSLPRDAAALVGRVLRVGIFSDEVDALDAGDAAARWVSAVLGVTARLVRATDITQREPDTRWRGSIAAPVNFPDAFPLLVCNTASLDELNRRLPEPIPMTRFRPNIVISGLAAFAEDDIAALRSKQIDLRLVKPCTRCSTTTVDQLTGEPGANPLPALKAFRFNRELMGVTFGQNAIIASGVGAMLRPGPVEVV